MALTAADRLLVATDTLRGLEADLVRTEITGPPERIDLLTAQIERAEVAIEEYQKQAEAETQAALKDARDAGVAAVDAADPESFKDDYDHLTKDQLLTRAEQKGIQDRVKANDRKSDIIKLLRANDLEDPNG